MFITCKQCSTTFRLDEKKLKPTGSKVRCSQCGNLFVAYPAAMAVTDQFVQAPVSDIAAKSFESPPQPPEDNFDRELDGIDLAELDSILEQERSGAISDSGSGPDDRSAHASLEEAEELDENDLDLDFESALALDEERVTGTEPGPAQEEK